jgi:hypothetical protein
MHCNVDCIASHRNILYSKMVYTKTSDQENRRMKPVETVLRRDRRRKREKDGGSKSN